MAASYEILNIKSGAFEHDGFIPQKYTGRGIDISPDFYLENLLPDAISVAVIMDDIDHPLITNYNHWLIWNIPAQATIPEKIPHGPVIPSLGGAVQGIGYGRHCYRGPKPPAFIKKPHRYQFHLYALDCFLSLDSTARKKELHSALEGHILQYGSITGLYQNGSFFS